MLLVVILSFLLHDHSNSNLYHSDTLSFQNGILIVNKWTQIFFFNSYDHPTLFVTCLQHKIMWTD